MGDVVPIDRAAAGGAGRASPPQRRWRALMRCYECLVAEIVVVDDLDLRRARVAACPCGGLRTATEVREI